MEGGVATVQSRLDRGSEYLMANTTRPLEHGFAQVTCVHTQYCYSINFFVLQTRLSLPLSKLPCVCMAWGAHARLQLSIQHVMPRHHEPTHHLIIYPRPQSRFTGELSDGADAATARVR